MRTRKQLVVTLFFLGYLLIVLFTNFSLTGFWTDIIFSIVLSILALKTVFKNKTNYRWLTITLRATNVCCSLIVFGLIVLNSIQPFAIDTLKLRSFYFQSVEGRLFNAYFKPVGAYSGGYGNFWITESPKYLPVIEWRVYWNRTVHHDFNDDNFDGEPTDNYKVVKEYIKDEVIDKNNQRLQ